MDKSFMAVLCLLLSYSAVAQQLKCGVDHPQHKSSYHTPVNPIPSATNNIEISSSTCEEQFIIPVVFHVFNSGGSSTIPLSQLQSALDKANEDFNLRNSDTATIDPLFTGIKGGINVKFVRATIDPNGSSTSGINYYPSLSGLGGTGMNNTVASYAWDNYKYLNVYVMRDLYGDGVTNNSGVAWLPDTWMSNNGLARVVYNDLYLGSWGTSVADPEFQSVFTHEMGHFFNLHHTFENGCGGIGDEVDDTPPTAGSAGCTNAWSCNNYTNGENYMDYNSCYKMFTKGQIERVRDALYFHSTRQPLWQKSNLLATGTFQHYTHGSSTPVAKMLVSDTTIYVGESVTFKDLSCYLPTARTWNFTGGSPANSSNAIETVTYNNVGAYPVTLTATNSNGTGTTLTVNIHVADCNEKEDFESTFFGNLPAGWTQQSSGSITFGNQTNFTHNATVIPANNGNYATTCPENWSTSTGGPETIRLVSKAIDLSNVIMPSLNYADVRAWDNQWPSAKPNHSIEVQVSTSPTGPWTTVHTDVANESQFAQWRTVQNIDLSNYAGQQIYISWLTSTHHYYWRIDDVCVQENAVPSSVNVFENEEHVPLSYRLSGSVLRVVDDFYLYSIQGQLLYQGYKDTDTNIGALTPGIYIIRAKNSNQYVKIIKS